MKIPLWGICSIRNVICDGLSSKLQQQFKVRREMSVEKECCACSEKRKDRSPEEYKDLINRLSRIEGQVRGIKAMVERGAYCPDILIQTSAVNAALNSFSKVLLSNHIRTCVTNDIREGNDEVVDELVATLQKMMK